MSEIGTAETVALTPNGRTFGAWLRGGQRTASDMRALLTQGGYVRVDALTHNYERSGYRASLLRRPHGNIDIMIVPDDEPVVLSESPTHPAESLGYGR